MSHYNTTIAVKPRNLKSINISQFSKDVNSAFIKADFSNLDLDASIEEYESIMRDTLDMHAPLKCKVKQVRASNPWFNDEIRSARKVRRQLEHKWMRSRLEVDRQEFCKQRRIVNKLVDKANTAYYSGQVDDCKGDQGKLFKIVNTLLHKSKGRECVLPTRKSDRELADKFSNYFYEKKSKYSRFVWSLSGSFVCCFGSKFAPPLCV